MDRDVVSMQDKLHYVAVLTIDELAVRTPSHCARLLAQLFPILWWDHQKLISQASGMSPVVGVVDDGDEAGSDSVRQRTLSHELTDLLALQRATNCRSALAALVVRGIAPAVVGAVLHSRGRAVDVTAADRYLRQLSSDCLEACLQFQRRCGNNAKRLLPLWWSLMPYASSMCLCGKLVKAPARGNDDAPINASVTNGATEVVPYFAIDGVGRLVVVRASPSALAVDFHGTTCLLYTSPSPRDRG